MDHHVVMKLQGGRRTTAYDLTDLHVWKVGKGKFSCILALETTVDLTADRVRAECLDS